MVGGGDRIIYDENNIAELLQNYKERKKAEAIFKTQDKELDFLDSCLKNIEPFEKDILEKTLIENVSIRQYSRVSGFSRDAVTKQRHRVLKMIAKFFNIMRETKECNTPTL